MPRGRCASDSRGHVTTEGSAYLQLAVQVAQLGHAAHDDAGHAVGDANVSSQRQVLGVLLRGDVIQWFQSSRTHDGGGAALPV